MSQVDVLRSESFLVRWVRPRRVDGELHRYEVKAFINSLEGPVILRSTSGDEHSLMMRGLGKIFSSQPTKSFPPNLDLYKNHKALDPFGSAVI